MTTDSRPLILHVIHHLMMGGMENGLVNLINNMPESRFRHAIACVENYSDFRDRLTRSDVEIFALNRSRIGVWKMRIALFNLCRLLKPALVHSRNQSGLDALLPARLAGVRHCIHGEHGWDIDNLNGDKWKPALLRRLHSPFVSRYITVSENLEQYLIDRIGIVPARVTQVYNGVDTERFAPCMKKSFDLFPPGFAQEDSIVIGTIGRLQPVKDQATLIRAFAELIKGYPEISTRMRLVIVGDGPLSGSLRALAATLGVDKQTWFPGALNKVPEVLCTFDIFVLPSLSEGISNTILEAMASGLPIIATAAGGNLELVQDGHSGRFFEPGNIASLTRLLADYSTNALLRHTHASTARRIAIERFSLIAMVENYQSIYEQYCGNGLSGKL
jgi:sugar transferase (PEP-CTERM/EpsH1 system associated)